MIDTNHFHPMMVHFPIALVTFGYIAELGSLFLKKELYLSKISLYLLVFGTLTAIVAWLTGLLFTSDMEGATAVVRNLHASFAIITMGLLIMTSVIRSWSCYIGDCSKFKWPVFILYTLATLAVSVTGYLGGTLVYNYMMPL